MKMKKWRKNFQQCLGHNKNVLEKVESESENGEDEEMDEEPSTGSDETAVCDVEADGMMNHTIPAPVHVAVPFMISTAMAEHVCDNECSEKDHNEEISCCFPLLYPGENKIIFQKQRKHYDKKILCKVFLDICNPVTTDDQIYGHKVLICTQVVEYLYDIYALF
ncbi:uncharacterized protein LOC111133311 isoform X4 [Crassostrea virginica]